MKFPSLCFIRSSQEASFTRVRPWPHNREEQGFFWPMLESQAEKEGAGVALGNPFRPRLLSAFDEMFTLEKLAM